MYVISRDNYPVEVMPEGTTSLEARERADYLKAEYCKQSKTDPKRVIYSFNDIPVMTKNA